MKLAAKKEPGVIPESGFHYMLFPMKMESEQQAQVFEVMGYIIIEVPDDIGERLVQSARAALAHQLEIAAFAEAAASLKG